MTARWLPSGLPAWMERVGQNIEATFARKGAVYTQSADLPKAALSAGVTAVVLDVDGGGTEALVFCDGAVWRRADTGASV